jgi:hypothetical protein
MAVAFVNGSTAHEDTGATTLVFGALSLTINNAALVGVCIPADGTTVLSVTDDKGNTWTLKASLSNTGNVRVEVWGTKVGTTAATTITITFNASTKAAAALAQYSGENTTTPFGNTATAQGNSQGPIVGLTNQDSTGMIVGVLAASGASTDTVVADLGTLRESVVGAGASTQGVIALVDTADTNNIAAIQSMVKLDAALQWAAAAIEVRTTTLAANVSTTFDGAKPNTKWFYSQVAGSTLAQVSVLGIGGRNPANAGGTPPVPNSGQVFPKPS